MSGKHTSYRTPRSRAQGLGAAKHGVGHWVSERISALALVPLVIWAVYAALRIASSDHATVVQWLHNPLNAVLVVLLLFVGFTHMHAGLRVVIEDYFDEPVSRSVLLVLNLFVCVVAGALAIFSILRVALVGA